MKIVYVYADNPHEWNSSEWRCAVPARAINRAGIHHAELLWIEDFMRQTPAANALCSAADVIVVQRTLISPALETVLHWQARGKTVIVDFDDAYDLILPSNPGYRFWAQGIGVRADGQTFQIDPPPLTQFKWGLRLVQGATVSSERLAGDWQAYTRVRYLPNYIDLEKYQDLRPEPHDGIWIGWGGSMTHVQSFAGSGVLTALKRVCRARPQVKVFIHGNDQRVFEQIPLPAEQKFLRPWVPYAEWPRHVASFDIGLAPLHGAYDDRRSWIKVLEYLVLKIPWIASDRPPYESLRPYGWLVKDSPSAWERLLLDMIDHLADYKAEASRDPYLFGISQAVDANVDKIIATYTEIAAPAPQPARIVQPC